MTTTINGHNALTLELNKKLTGPWHAEAEIDGEITLSNPVVLSVEGVEYIGSVMSQRSFSGRTRVWIVGGFGGFSRTVEAQHYTKPQPKTLVLDVLRLAGEQFSDDSVVPSAALANWQRQECRAAHALRAITEKLGANWRVLDNGKTWIGTDSWAELSAEVEVIDEPDEGVILFAADSFAELAKIQPGTTFEGQRIARVTHTISTGKARTVASTESLDGALGLLLQAVRTFVANSNTYLCEVVSQNADGTLQLRSDDKRIAGRGLSNVPIRVGLPGFEVKVTRGAKVHVAFDGGDPSKPYAAMWTPGNGASVQSVEYKPGGISSPFVRVGDQIDATVPMGLPITGLLSGLPFSGIMTVTSPLKAIISGSGNPNFLG